MSGERELPAPPRRPRKQARAIWRVQLGPLDWRLDKLRQIEEAIEKLLGADKFNAPALGALLRRAEDARSSIDKLMAERPDELEGMTPDELVEWAGLAMEGWPDQVLEVAFRVYSQRHRGRMVFVADSGHRAEFDPAEGWTRSG